MEKSPEKLLESAAITPGPPGGLLTQPPAAVRFSLPREGIYWLVIACGLLAIGLFRTINLLTLLSCMMLGLWFVNAILAGRGLNGLRCTARPHGPVFAQAPGERLADVTNRGAKPVQGFVIDPGSGAGEPWFLPRCDGGQSSSYRWKFRLPRRGMHEWAAPVAHSSFPFGLARRSCLVGETSSTVVLPCPGQLHRERFRRFLVGTRGDSRQQNRRLVAHINAQMEFRGLRAFRTGDSPRWIHWRTSARCGQLMVREFEDQTANDLTLVVQLGTAGDSNPQLVEDTVSLAATICWEWCRQRGEQLVLVLGGNPPRYLEGLTGPDHALATLEALALAGPVPEGSDDAIVAELTGHLLPPGPVLVLTPSGTSLAQQLQGRLNRPVSYLSPNDPVLGEFYSGPQTDASIPGIPA